MLIVSGLLTALTYNLFFCDQRSNNSNVNGQFNCKSLPYVLFAELKVKKKKMMMWIIIY